MNVGKVEYRFLSSLTLVGGKGRILGVFLQLMGPPKKLALSHGTREDVTLLSLDFGRCQGSSYYWESHWDLCFTE